MIALAGSITEQIHTKMKITLSYTIVSILLVMSLSSDAQNDTAYIFTYGGPGHDHCREIEPTSDGGFILVGSTGSFGNGSSDIYLVKIDSNCIHQWSKAIGGTNVEWGYSVKQTFDGGYIIAGYTNSFGAGGYDMYLVKTDSLGDTLWTKTYGGSDWDFGYSIQITPDSGFIICGETYSFGNGNSDVYVVKTNKSGDILWTKAFGGTDTDIGHSVIISNDSNYVIVGETSSFGLDSSDVYLLKIDQNGDTLWTKRYGGTKDDIGYGIDKTSDNGYIIVGSTNSFSPGDKDVYMLKTDSLGILEWTSLQGDITINTDTDDEGRDVKQLPDGKYIIIGYTKSFGILGVSNLYAVLTDSGGGWISAPSFGQYGLGEGFSMVIGSNGNYFFAGNADNYGSGLTDMLLIKVDSIKNPNAILINIFNDTTITKIVSIDNIFISKQKTVNIYPNPLSNSATIDISAIANNSTNMDFVLYDLLGQKVKVINNIKTDKFQFIRDNLSDGIYFYKIYTNSENVFNKSTSIFTGKIILTSE